jgi:hypothetical protein
MNDKILLSEMYTTKHMKKIIDLMMKLIGIPDGGESLLPHLS